MPQKKDYWIKIRNPVIRLLETIKTKWEKIPPNIRINIYSLIEYLISGIIIATLIYSIINKTYTNYLWLIIDTTIILIYFEYYYVWIRKEWNEESSETEKSD